MYRRKVMVNGQPLRAEKPRLDFCLCNGSAHPLRILLILSNFSFLIYKIGIKYYPIIE
jgi:hypothetical protein